jgi:hypothetical protein
MMDAFDLAFKVKGPLQSYEQMWMGAAGNPTEKLRIVRVGSELKIAIGVRNRYKFPIFIESATLRAEYQGTERRSNHYELKPIPVTTIPGFTKKPWAIEVMFTPLSEGTFVVSECETISWNFVQSSLAVSPLKFIAARDWPVVSIQIRDFPEHTESGQCHAFSVDVRNDCDDHINQVVLAYDNGSTIIPLCDHRQEGSVWIVTVEGGLKGRQTVTLPFIYRATVPGTRYFHVFAATNGSRSAFAMEKCNVVATRRIEMRLVQKLNDPMNGILTVMIRTDLGPVRFCGIMNQSGHLLRTLGRPGAIVCRGDSLTVVAFTDDPTNESVEPWRIETMGTCPYALLLSSEGHKLHAQHNIDLPTTPRARRFRLEMGSNFNTGKAISCTLIDMDTAEPCFVRPRAVKLADSKTIKPQARWIGASTQILGPQNRHRVQFSLVATPGIFQITGFVVASDPEFEHRIKVPIKHVFQVFDAQRKP